MKKFALVLPWALYAIYTYARGEFRPEYAAIVVLVAVLAFAHEKTRLLLVAIYPVGLAGMLYDGMRPFQRVGLTAERVHLCDVRAFEAMLFGSGGNTVHDWFREHHTPALDLICALPYSTFIPVAFVCAAYLGFRDRPAMRRFTWAFFLMNVAGFTIYHLFPTAPPWYFHEHGCVIDLATKASPGPALIRVDAMLGISYFHGMYAKASSVFGAIPSLHCAYPCLVMIEGWRVFKTPVRVLAVVYWLLMIFASMYLDHHWLIDGLLGSALAFGASRVLRKFESMGGGRAPGVRPAPSLSPGRRAEAE